MLLIKAQSISEDHKLLFFITGEKKEFGVYKLLTGSPVSLCSVLGLTQRERGWLLHLEARTLSYWVGHSLLKLPISYLPGVTGISGPAQIKKPSIFLWGFPAGTVVMNLPANAEYLLHTGDTGSIPRWGRSPKVRNDNPVLLSGKFHGQQSLVG